MAPPVVTVLGWNVPGMNEPPVGTPLVTEIFPLVMVGAAALSTTAPVPVEVVVEELPVVSMLFTLIALPVVAPAMTVTVPLLPVVPLPPVRMPCDTVTLPEPALEPE